MERLKRKIDMFLEEWKKNDDRLPLIVKGDTKACRLTFDALGTPLVTTPDGTMYLLERV